MIKPVFRRLLAAFSVSAVLGAWPFFAAAQNGDTLEIGILPYLPTPTILERYQPLRVFLERRLHESVGIVTAPDYPNFIQRTQRREFPIVITVAHAARLAELEAGYRPILRPGWDTYAEILVRKHSAFRDIKDLRGKTIATPGAYAIVTQLGANWLRQAGLRPGQDVFLQPNLTHTTSLHAVAEGVADAAIISNRAYIAAKSDLKDRVRSLGQNKGSGVPGVVYMAHPALSAQRVAMVKAAILSFVQTPEGKAFVSSLGYDTLREMKPDELASIDPYLPELKQLLLAKKVAKH